MGDTEKRILFAVVISAIFMFAYPHIADWINPPKKTETAKKDDKPAAPVAGVAAPAKVTAKTTQGGAIPPKEVKEEFTRVETPLYVAVFTNRGGGLTKWELKKHFSPGKDGSRPINLSQSIAARGSLKSAVVTNNVSQDLVFTASRAEINLGGSEKTELVYSAVTQEGVTIEKRYVFDASSYFVGTEISVINRGKTGAEGKTVTAFNANVSGKDETGYHTGPIINTKDKLLRQDSDEAHKSGTSNASWFGVEDKYFLSVFILKNGVQANWITESVSTTTSRASLELPFNLAPGAKATNAFKTFVGPKEYKLLEAEKTGLEGAIEFGVFSFLAQPSLTVLNFFKSYVANYGLAIIILTVIIKVIFYPLTAHSLKSMKEMQKVQPQLAAIREKYKDDKEKLNKEMMGLYKRYKINPIGGCLPMVLQIPVFLALYEVLYVAIELRQAPFFLWLTDLSEKDPYYITPILMGASMFIQQKMTPTTADPMQAKIMLLMPAIFTVMFLNFPSGLVIYWLVNNILAIAQQYYVQRAPAKA